MKGKRNTPHKAIVLCISLLLFFTFSAAFVPTAQAAETVAVSTDDQLYAALTNDAVSVIELTADTTLNADVSVSRLLTINGGGHTLTFVNGASVSASSSLTLASMTLNADSDYAIISGNAVVLGSDLIIGGSYGIYLYSGGSVTSSGRNIAVQPGVRRAIGIDCGGGKVNINDLQLTQNIGSAVLLHAAQKPGTIDFGGSVHLQTSAGTALLCPTGANCPTVNITEHSNVSVTAPGNSADGVEEPSVAAIDMSSGTLTIRSQGKLSVIGNQCGIIAREVSLGDSAHLSALCMSQGSSAKSGSGSAAVWVSGKFATGTAATVAIGDSQASCGNGIYSGDGIVFGEGSSFTMRGNGSQTAALCTPQTVTLGNKSSVVAKDVKNGILSDMGFTTGDNCNINLTGIARYGIKGIGTYQVNRLTIGEQNTVTINADYCAIYTAESLDVAPGTAMTLTSGKAAPALWVDAATDSQGHLHISGSTVEISCSTNADAVHNSAVYCVGAITVDGASVFRAFNSGGFGIISAYGDINIGDGAKIYSSGGCGMYLLNGNLRLSSGGALYAEGLVDSGIRVEHGVLNAGEQTTLDTQGARFGVEVLGEGGVWISEAAQFDIRSTRDRAVYVQNGTLNIEKVERLSMWHRADEGDNIDRWWDSKAVEGMRSWDILPTLTTSQKQYADSTILRPAGKQNYSGGSATEFSGFEVTGTTWSADNYSRLGMYYSRPVARANTFFIPAGRSFSWWLYGESYADGDIAFEIYSKEGEGDFSLKPDGHFTYYAPPYTRGMQSFSFIVRDSSGLESLPVTVNIKVTASKPPIACSTSFTCGLDETLIGQLTMTDYDGAIASTEIIDPPKHGGIVLSSDGQFSYTPNFLFSGVDSFSYKCIDSMGDESNIGYVSFVVGARSGVYPCNDTIITESGVTASARLMVFDMNKPTAPPAEEGEAAEQPANEAVEEEAATEADTSGLAFAITQQPTYGVLTFSANDTITYQPYEDFSGSDMFRYMITDELGNISSEGIVTIATIPNQRPAADSNVYNCYSGSACKGTLTAQDVDGTVIGFAIADQPQNGKVTIDEITGKFTYKPNRRFVGTDSFTFTATDNDGLSSHRTIIEVQVTSLKDYLVNSGKLRVVVIALSAIIASGLVIVLVLVTDSIRRKKERQLEEERNRLREMLERNQNGEQRRQ